ncbi:HNH endonuclease [Stenotrophomonas maltophilia]|uniref:HNH endonuclease n=1 Tax=Stenotrophomonas maltophilia TaxID=40324 RepID=UPI00255776BA|nr:HNH endonuclease [Stenotrophomonas maltophilia]
MAQINAEYERIGRVNLRASTQLKLAHTIRNYGYDWSHSSAEWYRKSIVKRLRKQQKDRCCYCRRVILYNKGAYEVDHIIDKGSHKKKYGRFCFELQNLALACKDCNNNKGIKSVLFNALPANAAYPTNQAAFNWVHPHLHDYSAHITIHTGWIYEARAGSQLGLKVISNCKLDDLQEKEVKNRRAHVMAASSYNEALHRVAGFATEAGLEALCKEFGARLSRKWNTGNAMIEDAIRALVN